MSKKTQLMMENIMNADGDVSRYAALAQKSRGDYRTLNDFFAEKLKGSTKQELAKKLDVSIHTINNWEKNGIPTMKQAVYIALALGLELEETNVFFRKYAGMGTLYPADRVHAKYIYILVYRSELEQRFPYKPDETVKSWIDRVWEEMEFPETPKRSEMQRSAEPRAATEIFMDALMSRDMAALKALPFRSAGEKARDYLQDYARGGPFEKYYGNRSHVDEASGNSVKNGRALLDRYHEEEKAQYNNLLDKLKKGTIVHRDELIELAMLLRMTREQADGLLLKCGGNSISARELYEGALLMVWSFLSEMCPGWFGAGGAHSTQADEKRFAQFEELIEREYEAELYTGGPIDFQVMFSRQVDKALSPLPKGLKMQLREVPGWYLSADERSFRMEKRRYSAILSECAEQMCLAWQSAEEKGAEALRWSLKGAVSDMLEDCGFDTLDEGRDAELLAKLDSIEAAWLAALREGAELALPGDAVEQFCLKTLAELDEYYINKYAPKKKKGGAGGGQKSDG